MEKLRLGQAAVHRGRISVLCIGGTGQNGATLLSRMLGQIPGFVAVGELGRLWDWGLIGNRPCGCGAPFSDCPFWSRVGDAAFDGWDAIDGHQVARLREAVRLKRRLHPLPRAPLWELERVPSRSRQLFPSALLPGLWPEYRANVGRYAEMMGSLYRGIHETSRGAVIVDSMKAPYHVDLVRGIPAVDLRVVHLVRDSRGVAYSNTRWVERQNPSAEEIYRHRGHPAKTGVRWITINLAFGRIGRLGTPVTRMLYESLIASPREELLRIAAFAGIEVPADQLAFVRGDELDLPLDHLVAGNRVRLQSGPLRLRLDEEWKEKLDPGQRRLVSTLTWPLLRRYGYARRRAGRDASGGATGRVS